MTNVDQAVGTVSSALYSSAAVPPNLHHQRLNFQVFIVYDI